MKKAIISLPTIHCASCTKMIGMTLKDIPGITSTVFDIEKKSLAVEFDETTSTQAIMDTISNDAGYEAILESEEEISSPLPEGDGVNGMIEKIPPTPLYQGGNNISPHSHTLVPPSAEGGQGGVSSETSSIANFEVSGMHCTSCAGLIERSLKHIP